MGGKRQPVEIRLLVISIIVLLLAFAVVFAAHFSATDFENDRTLPTADYHFVMVSKSVADPYWQEIYNGARDAAAECNAVVELSGPQVENADDELNALDCAIAARVDGIITHVTDASLAEAYIDKATDENIPVFTVENDAPSSKRQSFIGINSYKLGQEWGKQVIAAAAGRQAQVAMLINRQSSDDLSSGTSAEDLMYSGLMNAVKDNPEITVISRQVDPAEPFGTEQVIKDIILEDTDVNIILCTTAEKTVSAAETLISLNKVGKISLIGYHDSRKILDYINKNVLYATASGNAYQMGYQSVKAMVELKRTGSTNLYITAPITVITAENVSEFLKAEKGRGGDAH